jgi:hypothetical protein
MGLPGSKVVKTVGRCVVWRRSKGRISCSGEEIEGRFSYGANFQGADHLPRKGWAGLFAILALRATKQVFYSCCTCKQSAIIALHCPVFVLVAAGSVTVAKGRNRRLDLFSFSTENTLFFFNTEGAMITVCSWLTRRPGTCESAEIPGLRCQDTESVSRAVKPAPPRVADHQGKLCKSNTNNAF